jgi:two-component system, cell cycle sensor histidine kinase PleC
MQSAASSPQKPSDAAAPETTAWEPSDTAPWERDLLTLFVRNQIRVVFAVPLLAGLFALVSLLWMPPLHAGAWFISASGCQAIQYFLCRQYLENDKIRSGQMEWVGMLAASEFLIGACWSLLLFLFWKSGSDFQHVYLIATIMAVIAVRIMIAANYMPVIIAGTGFMTFNVAIRCILEGAPLYVALGAMAIGLQIFFIQVAVRLQGIARDMLIFKAQKERLLVELRREKERSDEARARAEEASQAKSQFLATMSHELRTPLNAIMGFSEILRHEMFGPHGVEAYKDYAGDIHTSGNYLLALINDILDLSRIEAGRRELHEEPIALAVSINDAVRLVEMRLNEKKITLSINLDENLPKVMADRRALHQIWLNLLSNAVKFTPARGQIEIAAERTPEDGLALHVKDTGPGIPPHEIEAAMGAFSRGSYATHKAIDGAGLGLPIVKGLISLHGGTFDIKARDAGGTEATIVFPERRVLGGPRGEVLSAAAATQSQRKLIAITR